MIPAHLEKVYALQLQLEGLLANVLFRDIQAYLLKRVAEPKLTQDKIQKKLGEIFFKGQFSHGGGLNNHVLVKELVQFLNQYDHHIIRPATLKSISHHVDPNAENLGRFTSFIMLDFLAQYFLKSKMFATLSATPLDYSGAINIAQLILRNARKIPANFHPEKDNLEDKSDWELDHESLTTAYYLDYQNSWAEFEAKQNPVFPANSLAKRRGSGMPLQTQATVPPANQAPANPFSRPPQVMRRAVLQSATAAAGPAAKSGDKRKHTDSVVPQKDLKTFSQQVPAVSAGCVKPTALAPEKWAQFTQDLTATLPVEPMAGVEPTPSISPLSSSSSFLSLSSATRTQSNPLPVHSSVFRSMASGQSRHSAPSQFFATQADTQAMAVEVGDRASVGASNGATDSPTAQAELELAGIMAKPGSAFRA